METPLHWFLSLSPLKVNARGMEERGNKRTLELVAVDLEVVQGLCNRLLEWSWVGLLGLLDLCGRGEDAHDLQ